MDKRVKRKIITSSPLRLSIVAKFSSDSGQAGMTGEVIGIYFFFFIINSMELSSIFLIGFVLAALLTWGAVKVFPSLKLLDFPHRYGLKRKPIPYPGGLVLWVLSILFLSTEPTLWFLSIPLMLLGVISFWDDRCPLPVWIRGIVHLISASLVFYYGIGIEFVGNPFSNGASFDLTTIPLLSAGLTVVWIILIQNAMNWFDGIKGLSVGVSGIGFLTLGIFGLVRQEVAWEAGLESFLMTSFFLAGICAGAFLLFWRGKIILGDSGSQTLGFLLAVLSIFAGTKIATTLLVLGLPILDLLFVIIRRVFKEKVSPFRGDKKHLHHNLARKIGEQKTSLLLIAISGILGVIAIFVVGFQKLILLAIAVILIFLLSEWGGKNLQTKR